MRVCRIQINVSWLFDRLFILVTRSTLSRIWYTTLSVLIELLIMACGKEEVKKM